MQTNPQFLPTDYPQWSRNQERDTWMPQSQQMDMMMNNPMPPMMLNQSPMRVINLPPTMRNQNFRQIDPFYAGGGSSGGVGGMLPQTMNPSQQLRTVNLPPVNLRNQNF